MITTYRKVPNGAIFKVLHPEKHRSYGTPETEKMIPNDGTYVKIGPSHAVNIADHMDAIFELRTPVRVLRNSVDTSHLPDWEIIAQGKPTSATSTKGAC